MPPAPTHPRATLDVERFLPYRLSMLSRRLSEALEAYYGPRHGLQRAEWRMLALIDAQPRCTAAALVRRASLDAVAVHRAVKRLIDAGLVIRSASASDGRAKLLRLSARGQRVHDDIVPVALALERRVLAALPAGQARALQAALVRLTAQRWTTVPEAADGPATDAPAARGQCFARASKAGQPG